MSLSVHERNRANDIYVLGRGDIQGVTTVGPTALSGKTNKGTTIGAEKIYKTDFTTRNKKFVLSLHYNGDNSYLFVNGVEQLKFKAKINSTNANLLCLGNISSDWSLTNSAKTRLLGTVYDFAVDYMSINSVRTIYDIHRYLMKKHNM